jgi:Gpi18-like mannosyltransferase
MKLRNKVQKNIVLVFTGLITVLAATGAVFSKDVKGINPSMLSTAAIYMAMTSVLVVMSIEDGTAPSVKRQKSGYAVPFIILAGFAIRMIIGLASAGYETDMACWTIWSQTAAGEGLTGIYTSGIFIDYPPGYVYVLHLLGNIANLLGIEVFTPGYNLLVKMPSIIADMVLVYIIYSKASEKINGRWGAVLALLYMIHPMVILDSAGWGQVDGLLTLFVVLYLIALKDKKIVKASVCFTIGLLIKPQMLFFGPVLAVVFIKYVMGKGFRKGFSVFAKGFGFSAAIFIAAVLPLSSGQRWTWVIEKYFGAVESYDFITLNSANLYGMLGLNWMELTTSTAGKVWFIVSISAMVISVAGYFILSFMDRKDGRMFFLAAVLMTGIFVLGPKMHERYIFPVIAILLMSYVYEGGIEGISFAGIIGVAAFVNCAQVLSVIYIPAKNPVFITSSLIMTLCYIAMTGLAAFEIIGERRKDRKLS